MLPIWNPNQIEHADGFTEVLLEKGANCGVSSSEVTSICNSFGLGKYLWDNPNLSIHEKTVVSKPEIPDGSLHYLWGWLTTDSYFETIKLWRNQGDEYFRNLYLLTKELRSLPTFTGWTSKRRINVVPRLISNRAYIKRGHLPFPELFFQTWNKSTPSNFPQILLWIAYQAYAIHRRSAGRVIFDTSIIDTLSFLRNILTPQQDSERWKSIGTLLGQAPLMNDPSEVYRYILSKCEQAMAISGKSGASGATDLKRTLTSINQPIRPAVYLGNNFDSTALEESIAKYEALNDLDTDVSQISNIEKTPSSPAENLNNPCAKFETEHQRGDAATSAAEKEHNDTQTNNAIRELLDFESSQIGSKFLEFSQRCYFATNPYLRRNQEYLTPEEIITAVRQLPSTKTLCEHEPELLSLLIWIGIEIGGNFRAAASLKISFEPSDDFGFTPDLSAIWRLRPSQQKSRPRINSSLFIPIQEIETRQLPRELAELLDQKWAISKTYRLIDLFVSPTSTLEHLTIQCGEALGFYRDDWLSNQRALELLKGGMDEIQVTLIQSNSNSQLPANSAYRSVVRIDEDSNQLINVAGSPYFFNLSELRNSLDSYFGRANEPVDSLVLAWNNWVDQVITYLLCATGARPIVDPFPEIANVSLTNGYLIIDDKDLLSREARRIVKLPKRAHELLRTYIKSINDLATHLGTSHPLATALSSLTSNTIKQKIPLFFHLSSAGVTNVSAHKIAASINPDLPPNFARHLVSNHVELKDKEIIDAQLGHQLDGIHTHGPGSLRVLERDLVKMSAALDELLEVVAPTPPRPLMLEGLMTETIGAAIPSKFGRDAKFHSLKNKHKEIREIIQALLVTQNLAEVKSKAHAERLFQTLSTDCEFHLKTKSERAVADRILLRELNQTLPEKFRISKKAKKSAFVEEFVSKDLLRALENNQSSHSQLMGLLRGRRETSQASNFFLFILSLIKLNGMTGSHCLSQLFKGRYKVGRLGDSAFVEIFPALVPSKEENCIRFQLTDISVDFHSKVTNIKDRTGEEAQDISKPLRDSLISTLGLAPKTGAIQILQRVQAIESAHQQFHIPGTLASIANEKLKHRSTNQASFASENGLKLKQDAAPAASKVIEPGEQGKSGLASILLKETGEKITPSTTIDELIPENLASTHTLRAIREYVKYVLSRTNNYGNPLATSTKKSYVARLQNFFFSTDAEDEIEAQDTDGLQETISDFLDERAGSIRTVDDDARQIRWLCDQAKALNIIDSIVVPYYDDEHNPNTTIYSNDELTQLEELFAPTQGFSGEKFNSEEVFLFTSYRYCALRRQEGLHTNKKRLFAWPEKLVIQIRGDSVFRPKTKNANRIIFNHDPLPNPTYDRLKAFCHSESKTEGAYFIDKELRTKTFEKVISAVQMVTGRGSAHTFRHTYANNVIKGLLNLAAWEKDSSNTSNCSSRAINITTPQGIRRHTLLAAGRLLGHSSYKTAIETYSHCGYEILDSIYRQRTRTKATKEVGALFDLYDFTEQVKESKEIGNPLEQKNGEVTGSRKVVEARASSQIKESLSRLSSTSLSPNLTFEYQILRFLKGAPNRLKLPSSSEDRSTALFTKKLFDEISTNPLLKQSPRTAWGVITEKAIEALNPYMAALTKRESCLANSLLNENRNNLEISILSGIKNFTDKCLYAVRQSNIEADLLSFHRIIVLAGLDERDFSVKTNTPMSHPLNLHLESIGIIAMAPLKRDAKRTIGFNLEYEDYWLFSYSKKNKIKSPPFDNTNLYRYSIVLYILRGLL